jgi:hypothetical protein
MTSACTVAIDLPTKRAMHSSSPISTPISASISTITRLATASLSTRTPSQSKMVNV